MAWDGKIGREFMDNETNPEKGYQPSREEMDRAQDYLTQDEYNASMSREEPIISWENMESRIAALLEQFEEKRGPFLEMLESGDSLSRAEFLLTGSASINVFYGEGIVPVTRGQYEFSPGSYGRNISNTLGIQNTKLGGRSLKEKMEFYDQDRERIQTAQELIAVYENHIKAIIEKSPILTRYADLAERFFQDPLLEFTEEEEAFLRSLDLNINIPEVEKREGKTKIELELWCKFGDLFKRYVVFAEEPDEFAKYSSQMIELQRKLKGTGRRPRPRSD